MGNLVVGMDAHLGTECKNGVIYGNVLINTLFKLGTIKLCRLRVVPDALAELLLKDQLVVENDVAKFLVGHGKISN